MWRSCEECGKQFKSSQQSKRSSKDGWSRCCSRACAGKIRGRLAFKGTKKVCRRLKDGEPTPSTDPKRYMTRDGYVLYRWRVGPKRYVEALEHRIVAGELGPRHVHHRNGIKTDNRAENLEPLTVHEHSRTHWQPSFNVDEAMALYRSGWRLYDIAEKYGIHHVTAMRTMRKRGLVTRSSWESRRLPKAVGHDR